MWRLRTLLGTAVVGLVLTAASLAVAQAPPATLPANSVYGRLGAGQSGPGQAIPFATLFAAGGVMTGPGSSTIGDIALYASATGNQLSDYGGITPLQYPYLDTNAPTGIGTGIAFGHVPSFLNDNWALINNGVYPFRIFAENNLAIGASGSTVGCSGGTGASSCGGLTFSANISWTGQSAVPISYTGLSTDTPATVKVGLCNALLANSTLVNTGSFICDPTAASGGTFNISWDARLASVVISSTGTGTFTPGTPANAANRDGVDVFFDHYTPGYTAQVGDQGVCLGLGSQGAIEEFLACDYTVATGVSYQSGVRFGVLYNGGLIYVPLLMSNGLSLPDVNNNTPAYQGFGTIALPNAGSLWWNGTKSISQSGDGNFTWLNGVNGGALFVSGTQEFEWTATTFAPTTTNAYTLGTSSLRWSDVYGVLGNFSGALETSSPSGGVGYTTGAGGTVTQLTSRTTGVTLNTVTGAITLFTATGSTTAATFTVTDSSVAANDTVTINEKSGSNLYETFATAVAAGSFNVTFFTTGGTTSDSPVFNFNVVKGSAN